MSEQDARLAAMELQIRALRVTVGVTAGLLLVLAVTALRRPDVSAEVLRVRGLVVVDEAGRDRILIGAPIPPSTARARTDMVRVRELWGRTFGPRYVNEWYPTYRNAVHGIVVLDEHGIDRVALGDSLPDPNIGRRIGSDVGLLINDAQGFERTGYGLLTVQGRDRAVLGLDASNGTEGLTLSVVDSGATGVTISRGQRRLFLGALAPDSASPPFLGVVARDGKVVKHEVNMLSAP